MPFTIEQFLGIFQSYNDTVYPFQAVLIMAAVFIIIQVFRKRNYADNLISWILMFFWLWMGIVYHINFFSSINPAAYFFGAAFILQALFILKSGIIDKKLNFGFIKDANHYIGLIIILYALLIYPVLNVFFGHVYPGNPTFGLPCPTTIFTFGMFLLTVRRIPLYLLIIPFLWALLGISAALQLRIYEDTGLILSGILAVSLIVKDKMLEKKFRMALINNRC